MKKILQSIVFSCIMSCVSISFATEPQANSPQGYWKTIDDVSHKPKSILTIYPGPNNTLLGKVIKIYPRPGYDQHELCSGCKGARHNQPILGMVVMEGLTQNATNAVEWTGGSCFDPSNGKTYHCFIRLSEDGQKLNVRGYVGIPLFGRSQTWVRVSNPARE